MATTTTTETSNRDNKKDELKKGIDKEKLKILAEQKQKALNEKQKIKK